MLIERTLKCNHGLLHDILQYMKLDSFVDIVFQDLVFVLSDVIDCHCTLYTVI